MNHEDIVRDWDLMDLYTNIYGLQWDWEDDGEYDGFHGLKNEEKNMTPEDD